MNTIDHIFGNLFSWPVAAVVLGLIFRRPLGALFSRLISIKAPGVEISSAEPVASNQANLAENSREIASTLPALTNASVDKLNSFKSFGASVLAVRLQEDAIDQDLLGVGLQADSEVAQILRRQLAVSQCLYRAEFTYRLIFGSQIIAIKHLNVLGSQGTEVLVNYYEQAKATFADSYEDFSFDDWLIFLLKQSLVARDSDTGQYAISIWGRDFLEWMVASGVSEIKRL